VPGFIAPPSPPAASTPSSVTGARAWLGLQMDYWPAGGAFVSDVSSGSPAAAAGLQQGDVIVKVDGQDVNGPGDVVQAIDAHKPGDSLSMQVQRGLDTVGVHVTLAQRPAGLQSQYP
jgi:S1-C subfamily serine protease